MTRPGEATGAVSAMLASTALALAAMSRWMDACRHRAGGGRAGPSPFRIAGRQDVAAPRLRQILPRLRPGSPRRTAGTVRAHRMPRWWPADGLRGWNTALPPATRWRGSRPRVTKADSLPLFDRGSRCLLQTIDQRLVGVVWISTAPVVELHPGVCLSLPSDAVYTFRTWTNPAYRGHGLQGRRHLAALAMVRGDGGRGCSAS